MAASNPQIEWYIRTIGFGYDGRRDVFYPHGLNSSSYLIHYSLIYNAMENNSTFHAVPRAGNMLHLTQRPPADWSISSPFCRIILGLRRKFATIRGTLLILVKQSLPQLPAFAGMEYVVLPVYGFFNHNYNVFAPGTANRFEVQMDLPVMQVKPPQQGRLF
jgi:uncharacterized protein YecE (DUF72 family)